VHRSLPARTIPAPFAIDCPLFVDAHLAGISDQTFSTFFSTPCRDPDRGVGLPVGSFNLPAWPFDLPARRFNLTARSFDLPAGPFDLPAWSCDLPAGRST
jgi:hypothetical protein